MEVHGNCDDKYSMAEVISRGCLGVFVDDPTSFSLATIEIAPMKIATVVS